MSDSRVYVICCSPEHRECIERFQAKIAGLEAGNKKLIAFVEDSVCECSDEYGNPLPYSCERCNLLRETNGNA